LFFNSYSEDAETTSKNLNELYKEHQLLKKTAAKQERYIAELEKQIGLLQKTLELVDKNKPQFIVKPHKVSKDMGSIPMDHPFIIPVGEETIVPIYPDRWIPVDERLPEETGNVIAYSASGWVGTILYAGAGRFEDCGVWAPITHWMPLPEAPKGE